MRRRKRERETDKSQEGKRAAARSEERAKAKGESERGMERMVSKSRKRQARESKGLTACGSRSFCPHFPLLPLPLLLLLLLPCLSLTLTRSPGDEGGREREREGQRETRDGQTHAQGLIMIDGRESFSRSRDRLPSLSLPFSPSVCIHKQPGDCRCCCCWTERRRERERRGEGARKTDRLKDLRPEARVRSERQDLPVLHCSHWLPALRLRNGFPCQEEGRR